MVSRKAKRRADYLVEQRAQKKAVKLVHSSVVRWVEQKDQNWVVLLVAVTVAWKDN